MSRFNQKTVLITGAARGQGAQEARQFVKEGARVVIADVLDDAGQSLADELGDNAAFVHVDVTSEADWTAAVALSKERFEGLDVLVNNAGIFMVGSLFDTSAAEFERIMQVNALGVFLGMKATALALGERRGSIVNISSYEGVAALPGMFAYTASKSAVTGMTKAAALELAPLGVRVNSVHPGAVDTEMLSSLGDVDLKLDKIVPLGRICAPDEVASLVLFLASDESSYCTGAHFVVDGGMSAGFGVGVLS
jgi:3alpha(or 20beta)-hydroxysteroid dehydrogenase